MATPIPGNTPSPEVAFENPGNNPAGTPEQFDMGQNPDGTFRSVGESVGSWRPNADPSVVNFEDLQHATARIVRSPEGRNPGGDGLETLSGAGLLSELRGAINDFNGVGSERETMSRLSRFNPFRHENQKHTAEDVRRAAGRLDAVQEEMSVRLEETLRDKERNGNPYFNEDAIQTALAAHKLFGTFTVARLRKESLENQADRSNSRGILGRVSNFLTRRVVDIDQRVESQDISKMGGRLRKLGYFGITALPLGVAGIAAIPLLGLGAGAAAVGTGVFAAGRVGRGLFSAKIQNTADSITRAEQDQIERVGQQMSQADRGITSAFVEGGEAKVRQADRRLLMAAGATAAFGALGYLGGNIIGDVGRDLKDNGILHYMGDGVDKATDFGDDFIAGDGNDGGGSGGDQGSDGGSGGGDGPDKEAMPPESTDTGEHDSGIGDAVDKVTGIINGATDAASSAYQDIKEQGLLHYLNEGVDATHHFGDDVLNGVDTEHTPDTPDATDIPQEGGNGGADTVPHEPKSPGSPTDEHMAETHQRDVANFLVDAHTGERISIDTLNVKPGGGFITTFQEQYGLSSQQANDLYYRVEPHLRGMDGTYAGPGDVRVSAPGELKLSADARQAVQDELIKMGIAENKPVSGSIADAKALSGPGTDPSAGADTKPGPTTGGLEAEKPISPEEAIKGEIDGYLDPNRLQDDEAWDYVENVISGAENGAISAEQMSAINDQVTSRIEVLNGLEAQLDKIQVQGGSAELEVYEDRLDLALDRLEHVRRILEESMQRSQELDSGE